MVENLWEVADGIDICGNIHENLELLGGNGMKKAGFYFIDNDDDATSTCPECSELNTSISARKVLECIKINRPVYVQCVACKAWYNIGGDVEEGEGE